MHDVDYKEGTAHIEDIRQIDLVADMLGNELGMRVSKFTSEEDAGGSGWVTSRIKPGAFFSGFPFEFTLYDVKPAQAKEIRIVLSD